MSEHVIHWEQRFENYKKALRKLGEAVQLDAERSLSELERRGIIKVFARHTQIERPFSMDHEQKGIAETVLILILFWWGRSLICHSCSKLIETGRFTASLYN